MNKLKVVISILLLLSSQLQGWGQSRESVSLYTDAVELYRGNQYAEALEKFCKAYALDTLEMDDNNPRRRSCVVWIASCHHKLGNDVEARSVEPFLYELPPVDRRLTIQSDSIDSLFGEQMRNGQLDEALITARQMAALEEEELGGETWYSINSKSALAYLLSCNGQSAEAEQLVEQLLAVSGRLYGNECRYRAVLMNEACYTYFETGNVEKLDAAYIQLFQFLEEIGESNCDFAETQLERARNVYAQIGNETRLDDVLNRQRRLVFEKYGENSREAFSFLFSTAQLKSNMRRMDEAFVLATQAEHTAERLWGRDCDEFVLSLAQKASIWANRNQLKEARLALRECLKHCRKLNNPEALSGILSMALMIHNADKQKMDKDMLSEVMTLMNSLDKNSEMYTAASLFVAQAMMIGGKTHEAAEMVNQNVSLYERFSNYTALLSACVVLLVDHQYVNARKASTKGLDLLNKDLNREYAGVGVSQSKEHVNTGLRMVEMLIGQEGYFAKDTTAYSLSMIRQDLLQARLAILAHTDSLGTEPFMDALRDYARMSYIKTKDELMGDSIVGLYTQRLLATFGADSPQYIEACDLKERCLFERSDEGHSKAFALSLAVVGTERYEQLKQEYDNAYEEWKKNGGKPVAGITRENYETYKIPRVWNVIESHHFQEVGDSCMIAYNHASKLLQSTDVVSEKAQILNYMERLVILWSLCADSVGRRSEVIPRIRHWHELKKQHHVWNGGNDLLGMMTTARIYGDSLAYVQMEQEVADTIPDTRDELHAMVLLDALNSLDDMSIWVPTVKPLSLAIIKELDTMLSTWKRQKKDIVTYAKYRMLLTGFMYHHYWRLDISRSDLKDGFLELFQLIEKQPRLQAFRESYQIMSMLCEMAVDWKSRDYALAIKADQMRKQIAKKCQAATDERKKQMLFDFDLSWESFLPLGQGTQLRTLKGMSMYEEDLEKLAEDLQYAYQNENVKQEGGSQEQYETLLAAWNDIRTKQKNSYVDDEKLVEKIEKLTSLVCRYLQEKDVSDKICCMAYDIALFGKGYMLRSQQQLHNVIRQSGNRTVLRDLDEYLQIEKMLDDSMLSADEEEKLTEKADELWQRLRGESKSFDDYTKSLEASWRDVQNALADDEVAIEYIRSADVLNSYYALVLRKDYPAPIVTSVGFENFFKENLDTLYTIEGKYHSPWPSFIQKGNGEYVRVLDGIRRIYVSPTGVLHQISLESIRDLYSDSIMSEKYEIYRVSSTRELIRQRTAQPDVKAVLYGGISYSLDDAQWRMLAETKKKNENLLAMRDVPVLSRGAVESSLHHLEGTEREVMDITEILHQQSLQVECLTGSEATEDHLKNLSGSGVTLLHVATHGFYQSSLEATDSLSITFSRQNDSQEANALSRSGLFMAGASAVFDGSSIPVNVDDGVLTAREISHLDFTSLNLVALSACETAKGDITGDGVFGLQRGFKKAGANSLLMSLWKVDDEATCLLMTEFYKNWIGEGKTKHDALELAKQAVRSHKEKGWDDPKYWAAFILLDGLD